MRYTHALSGILIFAVCCAEAAAAEGGSRWWPFGRQESTDSLESDSSATNSQPWSPGGAAKSTASSQTLTPAPTMSPAPTLPEASTAESADPNWMVKSPFGKVSWPRFHKPEFSIWEDRGPAVEAERNAWVGKSIEPVRPSPFQTMKNGAHRVGEGTRTAWHKTVDAITPGDSSDDRADRGSRTARREVKPPFWKRMMGSDKPDDRGTGTVPEFMAQQRVSP